jgi:signal transduction histidine kinase
MSESGHESAGPDPDPASAPGPASIERLMTQLVARAQEVIGAQEQMRRLLSANRVIVAELSLPLVLHRIVEAAKDIANARYAALGVIGADGLLEQFIHVGMDDATVATIGELPKGRGVLGALIEEPVPIRLARIADDERSAGFPPGHPAMASFLGVPIRSRNEVFGNLYLTEREGGEFTSDDEDLVSALAATAGVAIANARLYDEARHRQDWLQASAEITAALLNPGEHRDPLELIADSVKRLADADLVSLVLRADEPEMLRVAVASGHNADKLRGVLYPTRNSLVELALETGRGVRIGAIDDDRRFNLHLRQVANIKAAMAVPLTGTTGAHGAIVMGRLRGRPRFDSADLEMAEAFASQAAIAQELATARLDQQRLAVLEDRDRIARDLHDHVIQRLFAAGLILESLVTVIDEERSHSKLSQVVDDLDDTIRQLRTSIFGLRLPASHEPGLRSAVLTVADQVRAPLGFHPTVRFIGPVDTVVTDRLTAEAEAVVREAATNAAKHAHATELVIEVKVAGTESLTIDIADDGVGLPPGLPRKSGLENLHQRAADLGGTFSLETPANGGTRLHWTIPLQN